MGIEIKKEKSTEIFLDNLQNKPADIVEADLEIPGIKDKLCINPILKAVKKSIFSKFLMFFRCFLLFL